MTQDLRAAELHGGSEVGEVEEELLVDIQLADHHVRGRRLALVPGQDGVDVYTHVTVKLQDVELVVLHEADLLVRVGTQCRDLRHAAVASVDRIVDRLHAVQRVRQVELQLAASRVIQAAADVQHAVNHVRQ
eukprot:3273883-Heterocapsa_arctica.AAC.1